MTDYSRGVIYLVWGTKVEEELNKSIKSVESFGLAHKIIRLDDDKPKGLFRKAEMYDLSPFDSTLFLDTDTVVLDDLSYGFSMAEQHGMAISISPACYARRFGLEGDTIEYNTGVIFFTKTKAVEELFTLWKTYAPNHGNDQAGFAQACQDSCFNPFALPKNWNFRVEWENNVAFGPIKVWHSRAPVPSSALNKTLKHNRIHKFSYFFRGLLVSLVMKYKSSRHRKRKK